MLERPGGEANDMMLLNWKDLNQILLTKEMCTHRSFAL